MNPEMIITKICNAIDLMIERSTQYKGIFPSILHPETGEMLMDKPPKIPGQRDGDRAHLGCNLIHDEPLLQTMIALAETQSNPAYTYAVDRYLNHFARNCTNTTTGLFPWGEHAFWQVVEERVGCSRNPEGGAAIHDHLRQVPHWLWVKLNQYNPACIQDFADGLDYHWTDGEGFEYIRHANIEIDAQLERGGRSCDFPRHSGFYIFDLSFAYTQDQRPKTLQQIENYLEYWWEKRDEKGLLLIESRSPKEDERFYGNNAPTQTLSLGISLFESAELIETYIPDLADKMMQYGSVYIDGFFNAPHNLEEQLFVSLCQSVTGQSVTDRVVENMSVWGSVYGSATSCGIGVLCLDGWRLTQHERFMEYARAIGETYLNEDFPIDRVQTEEFKIPASDIGLALELLADLYDITDETKWLEGATKLSQTALDIYFPKILPYGASGIDWYDSQIGPAFLIHGLARVALIEMYKTSSNSCPLPPNYTAR